jgi:Flp pilus assembly protein TadG
VADQSGQALVELTVGISVFVLLLVGVAEFGTVAYSAIEVSNAARAGVQYGAQSRTTAADTTGMQNAATQDAHDLSALISATASKSCTCANGNASTCLNTDCSGSRIVELVTVNTTATVTPAYHVPLVPQSFTLTGKAVMRVHQ